MSQVSIIDVEGNHPQIPTSFETDDGTAIPLANVLEILATTVPAGAIPIRTTGAANVVTIEAQISQAIGASNLANVGLAAFDSADFSVDANGFVTLAGGGGGTLSSFTTDINGPVLPDGGGNVAITGGQVFSNGSIANTLRLAVEATLNTFLVGAGNNIPMTELGPLTNGQLIIGSSGLAPVAGTLTEGTGIDIANGPGSITISVDGAVVGQTITGNSGGALSPTAGNWNILAAVVAAGTTPITTAGAGSTLTINAQTSQAVAATDATRIGLAAFDSAAFDVDANGFVQLNGGGIATTSFDVQANTGPGTDPVVPTALGVVTVNGAAVANHSVVLETRSRAANAYNVEVQYATSAAATDATKSGVAHFDSAAFSVDASGFVTLAGGSLAIDSIGVDATSGGGTNPVLPTVAGLVTVNGALVAAGTNPIRSVSTAANVYQIQAQTSQALAAQDATKVGLSNFDSSSFAVDANGFVTLSATGAGKTITGDTGGAISPTANNWNVIGQTAGGKQVMDTVGTALGSIITIEDRTWTTALVVDPSSTVGLRGVYTTIALAMAAAVSGNVIFVRPGTYTENFTWTAGVDIVAYETTALTPNVTIVGKITASDAGSRTMSGIRLQTNSDFILVVSGSVGTIVTLKNCYLNASNNTAISHTSSSGSSRINMDYCKGDLGTTGITYFVSTSAGGIVMNYCYFLNSGNSTTASSSSVQNIGFSYTSIACPISATSSASFSGYHSDFLTTGINATSVTTAGTGSSAFQKCTLQGGSASAAVIGSGSEIVLNDCIIDTSNAAAISGAGSLQWGNISFTGTSAAITVTTQAPKYTSNDLLVIKSPGAYPYTTLPQDRVILVDTSAARTITPQASPKTGQRYTIKDSVGSAATNAITITPSGKNIDGVASRTINSNYGSIDIVYNGTEWSII